VNVGTKGKETTMSSDSTAIGMGAGASGRPPAVDRDPARRPGVPFYKPNDLTARPPLDQQPLTVPVLVGVEVGRITPVFGTAAPPHGLSGLIRRAAYRIPEHGAGRWMLLMLGDRVDVMESRLRRHPLVAVAVAAAVVGTLGLIPARLRARARRRRTLLHRLLPS
jgi:hypothetical protein